MDDRRRKAMFAEMRKTMKYNTHVHNTGRPPVPEQLEKRKKQMTDYIAMRWPNLHASYRTVPPTKKPK